MFHEKLYDTFLLSISDIILNDLGSFIYKLHVFLYFNHKISDHEFKSFFCKSYNQLNKKFYVQMPLVMSANKEKLELHEKETILSL